MIKKMSKDYYLKTKKEHPNKWLKDIEVLRLMSSPRYIPLLYTQGTNKYFRIFATIDDIVSVTVNEIISLFLYSTLSTDDKLEQINVTENVIIIANLQDIIEIMFLTSFMAKEVYYKVIDGIKIKATSLQGSTAGGYIVATTEVKK
jgi:hypothetical protein